MVTYKLKDLSGKQITRHRSNIVPYYPKEIFVQGQMEKYFSDNSLLRLHLKNRLSLSQNLSCLVETTQTYHPQMSPFPPPCSFSEIPESHSENYNTRDTRLRRQPMKEYRVFIPQSKIWAARTTHF